MKKRPLIDNMLNPVIVFTPNTAKDKKVEQAKIVNINQCCRMLGLRD